MEKANRINILPPEVASKIAAGEVVERPASVVKELLENSLDADASQIEIEIQHAGKHLIRVRDNGIGIYPEDLEKAFMRHATSKIATSDDLFHIHSLGFRGEALYSIAAVSRTLLRSKTQDSQAWEVEVRAGKITAKRPTSMTEGTEVSVNNLFFNTPARRKFLKSDRAENRQIITTVLPYCLAYPEKDIRLIVEGRLAIPRLPSNLTERTKILLGLDPKHLISGEAKLIESNLYLKFLLGDANIKRSRRDAQFIFVNNRPVTVQSLQARINQVYRSFMPEGNFPAFIIWIDLPPQDIDINIHPTKREIRFRNEGKVLHEISRFIERKLLSSARPISITQTLHSTNTHQFSPHPSTKTYSVNSNQFLFAAQSLTSEHKIFSEPQSNISLLKIILSRARTIGIFMNKYGLLEHENTLYFIDMHAAQERVNYEKFLSLIETSKPEIQRLLTPITLHLSLEEIDTLKEIEPLLSEMGFEISYWKENTIAIHSHPQIIQCPKTALRQILSERYPLKDLHQVKNLLARRACRASIMAGDKMSIENLETLRKALLECKNPFTCPHGRPTIVSISNNELERLFLRKTS